VGVLAAGLLFWMSRPSPAILAEQYDRELRRAVERKSTDWAIHLSRKIELLTDGAALSRFRTALLLQEGGRSSEAYQVALGLGLRFGPAQARAVAWLSSRLDAGDPLCWRILVRARAEIEEATKSRGGVESLHELMARLEMRAGHAAAALGHLEQIRSPSPETRLHLALALARLGRSESAREQAEIVKTQMLELSKSASGDLSSWIMAVRASCVATDYDGALATLQEAGTRFDRTEPALLWTEANVYLMWAASFLNRKPPDPVRAVELLVKASGYPRVPDAVPALLTELCMKGETGDRKVRETLESTLSRGQSPSLVHWCLGVLAWSSGDAAQAEDHWRLSIAANPQNAISLNNLAWALLKREPPELDKALSLAISALRVAPDVPQVLDTRGQILAKMGRYQEAVVDLEAALGRLSEKDRPHAVLADAYEKLGMSEMSAKHRRLTALQGPQPEVSEEE